MILRFTFFLIFVLALAPSSLPAEPQLQVEGSPPAAPAGPEGEADAEAEAVQPQPFDLASIGLAGFPQSFATQQDVEAALALIQARLGELDEGREGPAAKPSSSGDEGAIAEQLTDPRIEALQALRLALQREVVLIGREVELDQSLAKQAELRAAFDREGLGDEAPYSITLIDELQTDLRLSQQTLEAKSRAVGAAQRRLETTAREVAAAERGRRQARDAAERAASETQSISLERALEAARLAALAADHRHAVALGQLALAEKERALAASRLALDEAKIEAIDGAVVFPREALERRLAELAEREEAIAKRIDALTRTSEQAEGALFEVRRRHQAANGGDQALLAEQVAAREAELAAARKGAEYLREAADDLATTRSLWERRYLLMQGADGVDLASWLSETRETLRVIAEEKTFIEAELGTLRSMQLSLARRLEAPDPDPGLAQAIEQRHAALDAQQEHAGEWLLAQEQLRSLAERLEDELEPRVARRTLAQRLEEEQARLKAWWETELFVLHDQGFYVGDVATALAVFVLVLILVALLRRLLRRTVLPRLIGDLGQDGEHRASRALVSALIRNTSQLFIVVLAFYAAMAASGLAQGQVKAWLWSGLVVVFWIQIGLWASAGAVDLVSRQRSRKELRDPSAVSGYGLILFFIRVGIWVIVLVSVLTHFEYPVTGLIGALGVGGIAIAFAMQSILADVFNSMAIILDKPFRVGDFIVTGDTLGVVEHIGVKTTHLRSLSGEQVVLSNTDILNSRIRNYKRMRERRVVFKLGVVYQTPPDKLERIPRFIEEIIRRQPASRFDRAHFFEYGDFALVFEIVYYVLGADYNLYMDTQQAINLAIYRRFEQEGIAFAYPTQEVIVRRHSDAR